MFVNTLKYGKQWFKLFTLEKEVDINLNNPKLTNKITRTNITQRKWCNILEEVR